MEDISFRQLARSDYPLLRSWLLQPHVQRWWADDPSFEALEADYGGCIDGTEPAEVFIALRGDAPFGLAQRYRLAAYPQYVNDLQALLDVPPHAASIDYLVGEEADIGRGLGTKMLRAFVDRVWQEDAECTALLVPVHTGNIASWRALEKIGFVRASRGELDPDNPADTRDHYIMRLERLSSRP
jgi:aminoglycoside 6'-N-acetyltransferase